MFTIAGVFLFVVGFLSSNLGELVFCEKICIARYCENGHV